MDAHIFDRSSSVCPICHRAGVMKPHRLLTGLLTCEHCRERLVVSWSGHYVRDPFTLRHLTSERALRRASNPLIRICRDFRFSGFPLLVTMFGSAVVLGVGLICWQTGLLPSGSNLSRPTTEQTIPRSSH